MDNEKQMTDLFIYQAESLAAADADMIGGDDFEIEYDGGRSGDVSISGLMAEALKRLRRAEADRGRLKAELEDRSHEPEMTASDAYHHCADMIEPHVVDLPHGTECNEQSLCRSVCGSLAYLIEHWQEARGLRGERDALAAECEAWSAMAVALANKYPVDSQTFDYMDEIRSTDWGECLAKRDARMKAEALEEMGLMYAPGSAERESHDFMAKAYRNLARGEA